jgi:hypothetical protein
MTIAIVLAAAATAGCVTYVVSRRSSLLSSDRTSGCGAHRANARPLSHRSDALA